MSAFLERHCIANFCLRHSLQAFSLPGSMYLSILGGAVWGVSRAIPLACTVRVFMTVQPLVINEVGSLLQQGQLFAIS